MHLVLWACNCSVNNDDDDNNNNGEEIKGYRKYGFHHCPFRQSPSVVCAFHQLAQWLEGHALLSNHRARGQLASEGRNSNQWQHGPGTQQHTSTGGCPFIYHGCEKRVQLLNDNNNNKITLTNRYSLTTVKLTALYKHLITKTTLTYISANKTPIIVA